MILKVLLDRNLAIVHSFDDDIGSKQVELWLERPPRTFELLDMKPHGETGVHVAIYRECV